MNCSSGKQFIDYELHSFKVEIKDWGNPLDCVEHKCFVFFLREIIVLGNSAAAEILLILPSTTEKPCAYLRIDIGVIQVACVDATSSQQEVLRSKPATRDAPFAFGRDIATSSYRETTLTTFKKLNAIEVAAKMQTHCCMPHLMPGLELVAI